MPFTLGIRFPFHLICYLAKEAFALACFSLHIVRIPEPSSKWLYDKPLHTDISLSVPCGLLRMGAWEVGMGMGCLLFPFLGQYLSPFLHPVSKKTHDLGRPSALREQPFLLFESQIANINNIHNNRLFSFQATEPLLYN